jgi:hypothetical protein
MSYIAMGFLYQALKDLGRCRDTPGFFPFPHAQFFDHGRRLMSEPIRFNRL